MSRGLEKHSKRRISSCDVMPELYYAALVGVIVCNAFVTICVLLSVWCTYDSAGRSWVKMKRYQESLKGREPRAHQKRCSGSTRRNWRHRLVMNVSENYAHNYSTNDVM